MTGITMTMNNNASNSIDKDQHGDGSCDTFDGVATLRGLRRRENEHYNRSSMFQFLEQQQQQQQQQQQVQDSSNDTIDLYWESWRRQMIVWQFSLAKVCDFHTDTIEVAMSVVDRFVSVQNKLLHQASRYQMACMASFYMAVKVHEFQCLTPEQLQTLSGGRFHASDIEDMEREILHAIQWRVNPPTIAACCESLVQLIPSTMLPHSIREQVREVAVSLIPLTLPEQSLASESVLALGLACVGNALRYILPTINHHCIHNHNLYRSIMQFLYQHLESDVNLYHTDRLQCQLRSLVHKSLSSGMVLHPILVENEEMFLSDDVAIITDDKQSSCQHHHSDDDESQENGRTSPRSVGAFRRYISVLLG